MIKPSVTVFLSHPSKVYRDFMVKKYLNEGYVIRENPNRKFGDGIVLDYRGSDEKVNS